MRILLTTQPGYGHLHPLVPFAVAARQAGHDVLVATAASMRPVVEALRLPFAPVGLDWLLAREREAFPELRDLPFGTEHFRLQLTRVFRDVTARKMVPDLLDICRAWQPDLILRDDQEHGGLVAAELLGIPHAVAGVLWLYPPELRTLVGDALGALLESYGLTGMPPLERAYRYQTLAAMPPQWVAPDEVVPPNTHLLRPVPYEEGTGGQAPDWLARMPEQPLAHANLGTIVGEQSGLNGALLEAFRELPVNLVLSAGPGQMFDAHGALPANIRVIDHIPAWVSRNCDVAIIHAGYGSTMSAIVHGRPMVLLPVAADQPRNARRCADLGLGIALFEGARSPHDIQAAVTHILTNPTYAQNSSGLQHAIHALPDATHGIRLLER